MAAEPDIDFPGGRENPDLIGHQAAQRAILQAITAGRLPHAWLIAGPRGIGKATLAYRFARYLLAHPDGAPADMFGAPAETSLHLDPGHPVFRRVAAGGHGDLRCIERTFDPKAKGEKMRTRIVIEQIRQVGHFFALTSAEGGWRIALIDGAEEMNASAANALLKVLEEPPRRGLLLLVSHAAGRLLPTVRSRCRVLTLRPLTDEAMDQALAQLLPGAAEEERTALRGLAAGSPGRALRLAEEGGVAAYTDLIHLLAAAPSFDYGRIHALGDRFARPNGDGAYRGWCDLVVLLLERLARTGVQGVPADGGIAGEGELFARLLALGGVDRWVALWSRLNDFLRRADAVNVDRKQALLHTFFEFENTARGR